MIHMTAFYSASIYKILPLTNHGEHAYVNSAIVKRSQFYNINSWFSWSFMISPKCFHVKWAFVFYIFMSLVWFEGNWVIWMKICYAQNMTSQQIEMSISILHSSIYLWACSQAQVNTSWTQTHNPFIQR